MIHNNHVRKIRAVIQVIQRKDVCFCVIDLFVPVTRRREVVYIQVVARLGKVTTRRAGSNNT